jgi:hypothetical protein
MLALASTQSQQRKKRNKSKYAKSEYMPTATNLSVAYGNDKIEEDCRSRGHYEGRMSPFK